MLRTAFYVFVAVAIGAVVVSFAPSTPASGTGCPESGNQGTCGIGDSYYELNGDFVWAAGGLGLWVVIVFGTEMVVRAARGTTRRDVPATSVG